MSSNLSKTQKHEELGGITNRQYALAKICGYEHEFIGASLSQMRALGNTRSALQAGGLSGPDWKHIQRLAAQGHPVWVRYIEEMLLAKSDYEGWAGRKLRAGVEDLEGGELVTTAERLLAKSEQDSFRPVAPIREATPAVVVDQRRITINECWRTPVEDGGEAVDAEEVEVVE